MKLLPREVEFFYSDDDIYQKEEPSFYSAQEFPAALHIVSNYKTIRHELESFIKGQTTVQVSNANPPNLAYSNSWKHLYFMNFLWQFSPAKKLFPKTYRIIQKRKDITLAGIALLESGGKVLPHCGDTNAIVRCHVGLYIPAQLPDCGLRVRNENSSWEEGGVVCFNDAYEHEAWNLTDQKRYVLIFDIIKPHFLWARKNICAYALGVLTFKYIATKLPILKKGPLFLKKIISFCAAVPWRFYLLFQK